jgi:hypothetical protein
MRRVSRDLEKEMNGIDISRQTSLSDTEIQNPGQQNPPSASAQHESTMMQFLPLLEPAQRQATGFGETAFQPPTQSAFPFAPWNVSGANGQRPLDAVSHEPMEGVESGSSSVNLEDFVHAEYNRDMDH